MVFDWICAGGDSICHFSINIDEFEDDEAADVYEYDDDEEDSDDR